MHTNSRQIKSCQKTTDLTMWVKIYADKKNVRFNARGLPK